MVNALLAVALPIALVAQDTFATISGTIVDSTNGVMPGVRVVAIDAERGVRREVVTDGAGRFVLTGLAQGSYALEADLPGFDTFEEKLTLSGLDVTREITLNVGTIQELVSVSRVRSNVLDSPAERLAPRPPRCGPDPPEPSRAPPSGAVRIGGVIRTPRKVFHVPPVYPEGAGSGSVMIRALIGVDGFITETDVTNRPSPALAQAATEAVRQWEFDPTLLNCVPVEVPMTVVVEFR